MNTVSNKGPSGSCHSPRTRNGWLRKMRHLPQSEKTNLLLLTQCLLEVEAGDSSETAEFMWKAEEEAPPLRTNGKPGNAFSLSINSASEEPVMERGMGQRNMRP